MIGSGKRWCDLRRMCLPTPRRHYSAPVLAALGSAAASFPSKMAALKAIPSVTKPSGEVTGVQSDGVPRLGTYRYSLAHLLSARRSVRTSTAPPLAFTMSCIGASRINFGSPGRLLLAPSGGRVPAYRRTGSPLCLANRGVHQSSVLLGLHLRQRNLRAHHARLSPSRVTVAVAGHREEPDVSIARGRVSWSPIPSAPLVREQRSD
ncbi:hypothetical protein LMG19087_03651 [Ralstonia wenshanensis]|nr:hypothetical protein LMG19087_03651 [Ralstonia wenshanensis]